MHAPRASRHRPQITQSLPLLTSNPSTARLRLAVLLRRLLRRLRHRPQVHLRKPGLPRKRRLLPGRRLQRGRPGLRNHLCPADLLRQRRPSPRPGQLLDCLGRQCHGHGNGHSERFLQRQHRYCHRSVSQCLQLGDKLCGHGLGAEADCRPGHGAVWWAGSRWAGVAVRC